MKALITGINGFVGSHLAEHLLDEGYSVSGTVLPGTTLENIKGIENKVDLIYSNICDFSSIREAISQSNPDQIYHLAAMASVADSFRNPISTFEVNVSGTINLLEAIRYHKLDPVILLVGSAEIYGVVPEDKLPIREDYSLQPVNPYAVSKAAVDMMGFQYFKSYGMKIIRTRSFNHAGPRQLDGFVVPAFAKQIAEIEKGKQEPALKVGNLEAKRDFTDVRDVVRAYKLLVEKGRAGEAYNVCSGRVYSIRELLETLIRLSSKMIEIKLDKERSRPSDIKIIYGDNSKIKNKCNWQAITKMEDTLKNTLEWWREIIKRD
ncbi:MAG: GDP-mannose 4,6-dehydratase [Candidatus Saganbacteria bacterium]|nr:GDP-mannose 4,6-dehydratase [Candidatus Saganbacteria bacterium]